MYLCTYTWYPTTTTNLTHFSSSGASSNTAFPKFSPLSIPRNGILNPIRAADLRFEDTLVDPLCQILLMLGGILGPHVLVGHDEALQFDAFADYEAEILDGIGV